MPAIDEVIEDSHAAAAQSCPMVPAKLSFALRLKYTPHHPCKLARRPRAASTNSAHVGVHDLAIYRVDLVMLRSFVVAHPCEHRAQTAVVVSSSWVDVAPCHLHADEIRKVLGVVERVLRH